MKIGYARVSTAEQNLDLQRDALNGVGCKRIYEEHASGKSAERPALAHCLKALRPGDVLVVWRLDRLGRSLPDLVKIVADLEAGGVGLESLTEKIETVSSTGRLVFHVFAALAEFERNTIRERTLAGLKAARARGRLGGRPQKLSPKDKQQIRTLLKSPQVRVKDVAARFGVSVSTLYKQIGVVTPEK
ncbi:MAG: recombinase family protein [Vulcanimicrobiaceae bacterium]